ncbi:MAG: hypothetical protein A3J27_09175 [Candidatus Tectomicrobia bacterium RIFCSPLOWO2_12_FULL_69_37]|nr:MAG: hypothetical protein A3J27_09175 [Candidatus Tectomicrobia bacterium RIFCSPLOWO2_12_FULL_69_37]OGL63287.1 MAG: hypothetical protein A3I72_11910 [Candidatus Tectomicrobia bacterium RIFCSPLOWO2_02_FULL_70_19]
MTETGKTANELAPGEEFEPAAFHVTQEFNENYLHAVEDFHPRYMQGAAGGPPIVHPALLINYSNITRSPSFRLPPGMAAVHTHEEVEYLAPAGVGGKLTVTWKVIGVYEKRGKPYQVVDALIAGENGAPVLRRKTTNAFVAIPGGA